MPDLSETPATPIARFAEQSRSAAARSSSRKQAELAARRDGRQPFGRFAWREPFRDKLVLAHLGEAFYFLRNRCRQILRGGAEHATGAHVSFGVSSSSEGLRPDTNGITVLLQLLVDQFGSI